MAKAGRGTGRRARSPALRVISGGQNAELNEKKPAGRSMDVTAKGKRVQFDLETWHALDLLARDQTKTFQELADEAFSDLLRKHGQPVDLKDALKRSLQHGGGERAKPRRKTGSPD